MIYRQRVIDAIRHKNTDLTPWAFEMTKEFASNYASRFDCAEVDIHLESHIMFGVYKKNKWIADDIYQDIFGVQWKVGSDGGDIGVPVNKIVDVDNAENYVFPELDTALLDDALKKMAAEQSRYRMFRMTYALYERAWSLMGMEETMLNFVLYPDEMRRFMERITEYQLKILDYVLGGDFEGVYFGDDWGSQNGLIMGPTHWAAYVKPGLKKLFEKVKSKNKHVLLHCCGDIEDIFGELIEIGCDVYNTVQPEIYDLSHIKAKYGNNLSFWGAISTQRFLPFAGADEVYRTSVDTIKTLGRQGGYIFSPTHALTPDIPVENVQAMSKAVKDVLW